jgi:hypothetical protein
MNCKACGHRNDQHGKLGCNQGFCKCELSNDDVVNIDNFTALRDAAEQMAERLRAMKQYRNAWNDDDQDRQVLVTLENIFDDDDAAALSEWERVSK